MSPHIATPLLLSLGAAGCFTWRPYEPAAPLAESPKLPQRVRVFAGDLAPLPLNSPYVRHDSLLGRTDERKSVGFALADVDSLDSSHFHLWRTLGATVVAPAAALFITYVIVCGDGGCEPEAID
jgi:hypothetical protein